MDSNLAALIERALGPSFRVSRELIGGAMSRVFVAHEVGLQREIVIKILAPELEAAVNAARFRAEVQRSAQLQHPHMVRCAWVERSPRSSPSD
jgi:serine/threonine-protein kinase